MNKRLKQFIMSITIACMMSMVMPFQIMTSYAATAKISFSDPAVMVGNEVNVSMKITSTSGEPLGGADVMLSYDPAMLEFVSGTNANGGAGSIRVLGSMDSANTTAFSFTLKFKALQAGSANISVSTQEIYDANTQPVTLDKQGNSTVTIKPLATYSKDATLKSLKISPGSLSPAFSPSVTNYTANVSGDVNAIKVSTATAHANAKVVVSGSKELKTGENTVVCKVTAEDGETIQKYTIVVTKSESAPTESTEETVGDESVSEETTPVQMGELKATIDGKEYGIAEQFAETLLPEGFEGTTVVYQDKEIMAGQGIQKDLTLLYLVDSEENGSFYIYNQQDGSLSMFVEVETTGKSIVIIPLEDLNLVPENYIEGSIQIEGKQVQGWISKVDQEEGNQPEFCLFYGMNWNGDKNFYCYDLVEKTIQRYSGATAAEAGVTTDQYVKVANDYNNLLKDYQTRLIVMIVLAVAVAVLLIILILTMVRKRDQRMEETPVSYERHSRNSTKAVRRQEEKGRKSEDPEESEELEEPELLEEDDFELIDTLEEMEEVVTKTQKDKNEDDFEFIDLDL